MSFNRYMHERNYYRSKTPDFKQLAEKYPDLKAHLIEKKNGGVTLDFHDPQAIRALTIATAKEDFQLDLDLSLDRLIPRIPQKLNYLHWIEDLLERKIDAIGIDVGSGCSCIHALLALRLNPQWTMYASEIDPFNYRMAVQNVERNGLQDRIHVIQIDPSALFDGLIHREIHYDFLMCNPPFYTDTSERQGVTNSRSADRPSAHSVNTAADVESIYQAGGEVEFVKRMIDESKTYATNVRVFTSQLGKKSSLELIKKHFQDIRHIETEFCQGNTMRWGVAWTFDEQFHFPEQCQSRAAFKDLKKAKRKESTRAPICVPFDAKYSFSMIKTYLEGHLIPELKLNSTSLSSFAWIWEAYENHWSHQRRRRRGHSVDEQTTPPASKRLKSDAEPLNKLCTLQARLDEHQGVCSLYLLFVDGTDADAANQIGQYIKNQFPSYCQRNNIGQ